MKTLSQLAIRSKSHLALLLNSSVEEISAICEDPAHYYREWDESKNGKLRHLTSPQPPLLKIQKRLNALLQRFQFGLNVYGGLKGKNHLQGAAIHIRKPMLLKTDVKDFFPRISHKRVYRLFSYDLACSPDIARILTKLTTLNGGLPLGCPTSTVIANLIAACPARAGIGPLDL